MRLRGGLFVVSCAVLVAHAGSAGAADRAASAVPAPAAAIEERLQLEAETRRLEAAFAAELAACSSRFAVTDCSDQARLRHRDTLRPLRARQLALADAERRERAAARLAAIESKRQAQRPAVPEPPLPRQAEARPAPASAAPLIVIRRDEAGRQRAASEAAARRAEAFGRRQQEGEQAAARVRERVTERRQSGQTAASLPTPQTTPATR